MINSIQLLRNVGLFDSVSGAVNFVLSHLTIVYAENGRGKTTFAAILRSLATGDPLPMAERQRLAAQHPPHIILECSGGPPFAMFQNNAWNRTLPNMAIFDDQFIDQNIYSGLVVASDHRQNLHELIIGAQGVALNQRLQGIVSNVEAHNTALRAKASAIPASERGTISVDEFCTLPAQANIDDSIQTVERNIAAGKEQDPVRNTPSFAMFDLPTFDIEAINEVLGQNLQTLDSTAAERVRAHLSELGQGAETWVANGIGRISNASESQKTSFCPFCAQDLKNSPVLKHYRAYFSQAYTNLKKAVSTAQANVNLAHGSDIPTKFERAVRVAGEHRHFWAQFCDTPDIALDTASIIRTWQLARETIAAALLAKQTAPLDPIMLSDTARSGINDYEISRQAVLDLNMEFQKANTRIQQVKQQAASANLSALGSTLVRLKAIKSRHTLVTDALCRDYLAEKAAKTATEVLRDQARTALDQHRENSFPTYQSAVNTYLSRFNAGFSLGNVCSANTRGGSTCTYNVVINNTSVPVGGGTPVQGSPSFRNTLSAGDRSTLALAFFLASLDQDPGLADKVVVIDDPVSSMDEHRALTTIQEIRRLAQRVSQVIILSHSKPFLCSLWEGTAQSQRASIQIVRDATGSTICGWDVNQDCITEHDRRHALLRNYIGSNIGNIREVARAIRPTLEAFMRVACPEHFPPGMMLGTFRGLCEQRVGSPQEILDSGVTQELRYLVEYANKFHHDTNPAWETAGINDGELQGFVRRTLAFAKR
jgi:wobble nucleotide-excising tRNase